MKAEYLSCKSTLKIEVATSPYLLQCTCKKLIKEINDGRIITMLYDLDNGMYYTFTYLAGMKPPTMKLSKKRRAR